MRILTSIYIVSAILVTVSCQTKREQVKPEIKELTEAVYASGTLVPEEEYRVVSMVEGYLVRSLVKEGDTVKKGQVLFSLGSSNSRVQVQAADALVQKTLPLAADHSPAIRELEGRIELARIRVGNDSLQYVRYKNLFEQDAISKSNYEKYLLQYQTASREWANLNEQLQQQKLSAALQLQQANNQLALSKIEINNGVLKSFANGIVYDVYKREGDLIIPNQPVALVGKGRMIAKLQVDEDDLSRVKDGQKVLITMDAFPDKVFRATVIRIYPILNKVEQSFRVDALPDEPLPVGIYGLNVEANIVIRENTKVMVLPRKVIQPGNTVIVKEGNKTVNVKISTGIEDKDWTQVTGGITENSIIILPR